MSSDLTGEAEEEPGWEYNRILEACARLHLLYQFTHDRIKNNS